MVGAILEFILDVVDTQVNISIVEGIYKIYKSKRNAPWGRPLDEKTIKADMYMHDINP